MESNKIFPRLFLVNLLLHLFLHFVRIHFTDLSFYLGLTLGIGLTKQLVVILALVILLKAKHRLPTYKWVVAGLILGWVGDLFLFLFDNTVILFSVEEIPLFFLLGLGFFLLGHIFYVVAFLKDILSTGSFAKVGGVKWVQILGVFSYASLVFYMLRNDLGDMRLPVVFYIVTISLMLLFAGWRPKAGVSFKPLLQGAFLFVLSDSILAFEIFKPFWDFSPILVMLTYGLAQYKIAKGYAGKD